MSAAISNSIVSPAMYRMILSSPKLQKALLPQGLISSPYEVLDYDATLIIHDSKGSKATFERTQHIRFLQHGVSGIMDHAWGDGVLMASYRNTCGKILDSFKDQGHRHMVVALKRDMARGEEFTFQVKRKAIVAFTKDEEWLETRIDHPIVHLRRTILFPKGRPCQQAVLQVESSELPIPVIRLVGGSTIIRVDVPQANSGISYMIRWSW